MGSIVVRGIDDDVKQKFREVAAAEGSSMEALLRKMIEERVSAWGPDVQAASVDFEQPAWISEIERLGRDFGGIELDVPVRDGDLTQLRPEADFSER